ncbi:energy transducer TonB [Chitinophagaceae bacterium LB-8]|uniref:Energy transducer TonB n=1 Tax=Paraflavisolibacter caeni TaxID=2982496 RepID=A0A9X3B9Y1_9BACT|nr:energy transducer TonB [Paraflavisolibacter caeni]MCU7551916.1 energy transducer TonB [Paraflavisolibacter caeni]
MKIILPVFFLFIVLSSNTDLFGQQAISFNPLRNQLLSNDTIPVKSNTIPNKSDSVFQTVSGQLAPPDSVEVEADFPGGVTEFTNFLNNHLNPDVPINKGAPAGKYQVVAQFIIDIDGSVTNAKALTNCGFGMEQELIRAIKLSPKWKPAIQYGRPVKAYRKQPITFVIEEEKRKKRRLF